MKKYIIASVALLLSLGFSGCKEKEFTLSQDETQLILDHYSNILGCFERYVTVTNTD